MKRIVYLIHHGEFNFPEGKNLCIGTRMDLSLSKNSKVQKYVLAGCLPNTSPGPEKCRQLWNEYHTPDEVQKHCIVVRDQAIWMANCLSIQNIFVNFDILESAALLHDLCRTEMEHEKKAAEVLRKHGWLRLASIVAQHHDRAPKAGFDETDILYLSDKYIQGTTIVTLKQRFEESLNRCKNAKAKDAHERRFEQAIEIEKRFLQLAKIR